MAIADYVTVSAEVMGAHAPVALETTAIAHGLPYPQNLDVAARLEAAVRAGGGVPAWCGLLDGRIRVGLTPAEVERFCILAGNAQGQPPRFCADPIRRW